MSALAPVMQLHDAYPIHSSVGGKLAGFATSGEARRCSSSALVYRCAIPSLGAGETVRQEAEDQVGLEVVWFVRRVRPSGKWCA